MEALLEKYKNDIVVDRPVNNKTIHHIRIVNKHGNLPKGVRFVISRDGDEFEMGKLYSCLWRSRASPQSVRRWLYLQAEHQGCRKASASSHSLLPVKRWSLTFLLKTINFIK
jgi:hypothetical protein